MTSSPSLNKMVIKSRFYSKKCYEKEWESRVRGNADCERAGEALFIKEDQYSFFHGPFVLWRCRNYWKFNINGVSPIWGMQEGIKILFFFRHMCLVLSLMARRTIEVLFHGRNLPSRTIRERCLPTEDELWCESIARDKKAARLINPFWLQYYLRICKLLSLILMHYFTTLYLYVHYIVLAPQLALCCWG